MRNRNARHLDEGLREFPEFATVVERSARNVEAQQLYMACFERRDELLRFLIDRGIEAKVHYPIPLHLQKASAALGYKRGDFPVAEHQADHLITLPAHQFIKSEQIDYMLETIREFYVGKQTFGNSKEKLAVAG
jgi:dTDP-4-amino-4,6-dideoxygalactose transaminase